MTAARQITFLSDFGRSDTYVGLCHAVMAGITPTAPVADLTHEIPPQDVLSGALALADCVPFVPAAVHLAVVDPGVGSQRDGVVIVAGDALLVGPDNGLLIPAARRLGGINAVYRLSEPRFQVSHVTRTFHGRDVFAPAAAHLAGGAEPAAFGAALEADRLVDLEVPAADIGDGVIAAVVNTIDRFDNVRLSATKTDLERAGLGDDAELRLLTPRQAFSVRQASTFADLVPGEIGVLEGSYGWLTVVMNRDRAARHLQLQVFERVRLTTS